MNLQGWLPARILWNGATPRVEWMYFGEERLTDPFFEQTLEVIARRPFGTLFRRETTMEELAEWVAANPPAPLRGLIFHVSRCGSTLISQQLAALPHNVVASEPSPLDNILRTHLRDASVPQQTQIRWASDVAAAIGQPRHGERAFYIKFDCWHIHQRELIRAVFPDVPWIFLYRDPLGVVLSHERMPAAWTVPGLLHPMALQMEWSDYNPQALDVYRAKALAGIYAGGLAAAREDPRVMLVNYNELPNAMWGKLLPHFGLRAEDIAPMAFQSQFHAKSPQQKFDGDPKVEVTERMKEVVQEYLQPLYEELEAERRASARS